MTKHNIPAVRFAGFDGEWETSKIADLFAERVESFPEGELLSVTTHRGIKRFEEIGRHDTSNADKSKYKRVEIGDIAYNSMRMWQGASGVSPYRGIVSPAYTVLQPIAELDSGFFSFLFKVPSLVSVFKERSQGLTSDTWNLKFPAFSEIEVTHPALEEQRAISELFADLDALIEQHRAKHANLQQTKSALMQRMFPQDGAEEPELRLGGYSGRWKRVLLGDTVESFKYGVNAAATDYDGVTKYLRITDLDESSGQFGTGLVTSPRAEEETIRDFLLEEGDMVFARTGATVGRSYLFRKSVGRTVWAGFLIRARFKRNTDPQFVAAYAQTDSYWTYVKLTSQRSGQPGLNSAEYAAMPITTPPTLEEQCAIGEVFSNLDALIAAEHRYIAQLTQAKTALLQRMFV